MKKKIVINGLVLDLTIYLSLIINNLDKIKYHLLNLKKN
jgi:hypothetical protein